MELANGQCLVSLSYKKAVGFMQVLAAGCYEGGLVVIVFQSNRVGRQALLDGRIADLNCPRWLANHRAEVRD